MKNNVPDQITRLIKLGCGVVLLVFFIPFLSNAQTRGTVQVVKDPLIDTLIARRPMLNRTIPAADESTSGFRVQIYFGSSRQAAYAAQARFSDDHPEYKTYVTYIEPNFKVHVGDFRTRLEAQKLMSELNRSFTSLFVIGEKINPKTDTE